MNRIAALALKLSKSVDFTFTGYWQRHPASSSRSRLRPVGEFDDKRRLERQ
ncbi:hypothetical protein ACFFWD_01115 [Bradyrhizobium erythrophlei]|uniref:hypothetical protein n=1 Tax=Bradyrhizobium erythrophlei TaxID=1437360 RepID=UPI0035EBBA67